VTLVKELSLNVLSVLVRQTCRLRILGNGLLCSSALTRIAFESDGGGLIVAEIGPNWDWIVNCWFVELKSIDWNNWFSNADEKWTLNLDFVCWLWSDRRNCRGKRIIRIVCELSFDESSLSLHWIFLSWAKLKICSKEKQTENTTKK